MFQATGRGCEFQRVGLGLELLESIDQTCREAVSARRESLEPVCPACILTTTLWTLVTASVRGVP